MLAHAYRMKQSTTFLALFYLLGIQGRPYDPTNAHWSQFWLKYFAVQTLSKEKKSVLVGIFNQKRILLDSLSEISYS